MPNLRAPRGVSATPKKKGGGMLSGMIGGMLGGGVTGGGFTPAFNADTAALDEFNGSGVDPTDESASIDQYSQIRNQQLANGVQSTPAGFSPYQVQNPILDKIFNRGQSSNLATSLNANQGNLQYQAAIQAQQAELNRQAEMQKQVLANSGMLDVEGLRGNNAINATGATLDANNLAKAGLNWSRRNSLDQDTGQQRLNIAANQANAESDYSNTDDFYNRTIAANKMAIDAPGMMTRKNSAFNVSEGSGVSVQPGGGQNGQVIANPSPTIDYKMMGGIPMMKDGKPVLGADGQPIILGGKPEPVRSRSVGMQYTDVLSPEMQQQAEQEAIKKNLAARASASKYENPDMANTPQGFPVNATPVSATPTGRNTAIIPSFLQSLNPNDPQYGPLVPAVKDVFNLIIRKLLNSNQPSAVDAYRAANPNEKF